MHSNIRTFQLLFSFLLITACQDVIDLPLPKGPTRLVVEASLDWEKGTPGNVQTIILSRSTGFYETSEFLGVSGAEVKVTNDVSGRVYDFVDQGNGQYGITDFEPVLGQAHTLEIIHGGQVYTATETMVSVPPIDSVHQDREEGFDDELLEVHIGFTDPPEAANNYLFRIQRQGDLLPSLDYMEDEFVNGNAVDVWYEISDDDDSDIEPFAPGDVVEVEMYGISRDHYDFISIIIDQYGGSGPYDSTPVGVRGNCVNQTDPENYPFGYFRLSEKVTVSHTFVEQ